MAHIELESSEPGIRALFHYRPATARPMNELVDVLLCGESTLSRGERELIASYVSSMNSCRFCYATHAAIAAEHLDEGMPLVRKVCADPAGSGVAPKLGALLAIAGAVQAGGLEVTEELVAAARAEGASDLEIHDTVLIAAAFCMFNRYVDGLATWAPDDPELYAARARRPTGYVAGLSELLRS